MLSTLNLLDFSKTLASEIFSFHKYPWEVLFSLQDFILYTGSNLPKNKFKEIKEKIWVANSCKISKSAKLYGPLIIDEFSEIRCGAYVRGSVIIGKKVVVGNSTEIKNCILFDCVQVPHFNYVGDSILGFKSHLGAGAIISNVRSDKQCVNIKSKDGVIETGLRKFGAILGDYTEVGCNAVINPGTIIGRKSNVYPLSMVRGCVPENSIYKNNGNIVAKF